MENLKIRVKNEAEIKEAQELFLEYGATGSVCLDKSIRYVCTFNGFLTQYDFLPSVEFKQITMSELRDLVVLKRNDVGDATHECRQDPEFKYRLINNWWHCITPENKHWRKNSITLSEAPLFIKPIEKSMKEYLDPRNGYKLIEAPESEALEPHASEWIKVPEGAIIYALANDGNYSFWNNKYQWADGDVTRDINQSDPWYTFKEWAIDWDAKILWKRHTQPEELPFIDDEPKYMDGCSLGKTKSLNDQYAEIEKARQATNETNYLMQGKNGEKLMESIKELKNTSAWSVQVGGDHYKQFKIQPMQFALENKLDAAQQNVIKYIMRHSFKNGKQDLEKAKHYIDLMIEHYYG